MNLRLAVRSKTVQILHKAACDHLRVGLSSWPLDCLLFSPAKNTGSNRGRMWSPRCPDVAFRVRDPQSLCPGDAYTKAFQDYTTALHLNWSKACPETPSEGR